jgi:hypothetical protein
MRSSTEPGLVTEERRHRQRANVHWIVFIFQGEGVRPLESRTKNLSSSGFYCFVQQPFEPFAIGESICCQIVVPGDSSGSTQGSISLKCQAKVLRVEPLETGTYGVACLIEDYTVVRSKSAAGE